MENEEPEIQQQKLDMKYEKNPHFSKELFESSTGLQQIADWFAGYNEYIYLLYYEAILSETNTLTK